MTLEERFWAKVDKNGPIQPHMKTPCWVWTGAVTANGYGSIGRGGRRGKTAYAHVVGFELQQGSVPEGRMVLHACDMRLCVRHLYAGTHKSNMADRQHRGRTARGDSHGWRKNPQSIPRGSARGHAKLTEADIRAIRGAVGVTQRELAYRYGVSSGYIWRIRWRRVWMHI